MITYPCGVPFILKDPRNGYGLLSSPELLKSLLISVRAEALRQGSISAALPGSWPACVKLHVYHRWGIKCFGADKLYAHSWFPGDERDLMQK